MKNDAFYATLLLLNFKGVVDKTKKACRICNKRKDKQDFHRMTSEKIINGRVYKAKYRSECKLCRKKGQGADSKGGYRLMKQLNMKRPPIGTPCDLCLSTSQKLHFDHDHDTGKFRGWLCIKCNTSIGHLGDSVAGLQRAITYLQQ